MLGEGEGGVVALMAGKTTKPLWTLVNVYNIKSIYRDLMLDKYKGCKGKCVLVLNRILISAQYHYFYWKWFLLN